MKIKDLIYILQKLEPESVITINETDENGDVIEDQDLGISSDFISGVSQIYVMNKD